MKFSQMYCESLIVRGVPIFVDFVVQWNHEIKNPTKCIFSFSSNVLNSKPRIKEPMKQWKFGKQRKLMSTNKSAFTVSFTAFVFHLVQTCYPFFWFLTWRPFHNTKVKWYSEKCLGMTNQRISMMKSNRVFLMYVSSSWVVRFFSYRRKIRWHCQKYFEKSIPLFITETFNLFRFY